MLGEMFNRVAALLADIAMIDAELGRELRHTTRRIVAVVRLLEILLVRFGELERRLERIIREVEETTGQKVDDELYACLAGRVGILRVRSGLERVRRPDPDEPEPRGTPDRLSSHPF